MASETAVTTIDERMLVDALKQGDEDAFARALDEYSAAMLGAAVAITRDRASAEDVVQEAWLGAIRGLRAFEGRSSFRTWLLGITINQARTRASRERRTIPFSAMIDVSSDDRAVAADRFEPADHPRYPRWWKSYPSRWSEVPDERILGNELVSIIERAVDALPEAQRIVITLRDVAGYSAQEVRNALGITETNERVLLHRARSRVRRAIERYLDDEDAL